MSGPIRVVLAGASGRTGREVGRAILSADDMTLAGAIGNTQVGMRLDSLWPGQSGDLEITAALPWVEGNPVVLVDFTEPKSSYSRILEAIDRGWHVVVGTTGFTSAERQSIRDRVQERGVGAALIANFSLGAWLIERLVEEAARYFSEAELVEAHHPHKKDRPSGTAKRLAERLAHQWGRDLEQIPVHAIRLPGMVAHQEVLFGAPGQVLTIRHDVHDRSAYTEGVLRGIRRIEGFAGQLIEDPGPIMMD